MFLGNLGVNLIPSPSYRYVQDSQCRLQILLTKVCRFLSKLTSRANAIRNLPSIGGVGRRGCVHAAKRAGRPAPAQPPDLHVLSLCTSCAVAAFIPGLAAWGGEMGVQGCVGSWLACLRVIRVLAYVESETAFLWVYAARAGSRRDGPRGLGLLSDSIES